jgi:hypothetical protein
MITFNYDKLKNKIKKAKAIDSMVMPKAYNFFKEITPIKNGNARRNTRLDNQNTIKTNYKYAGVLDSGSSKQAPQGMSQPTTKKIKELVKNYIKTLGA